MLRPGELLIHDGNAHEFLSPVVGGVTMRHGLKPRDYSTHPAGCYAGERTALDFPLIPRAEWSARLKDKIAEKSLNSDIRLTGNAGQPIPSRDQNGKGYCWAHSGVSTNLVTRAARNLPYVSLSAYAIACIIKSYADEGGWGAQGVDFQMTRGCPSDAFWAQQSMSRGNDKPETWANAALHKVTEGWMDLAAPQYNRNLTFDQLGTCLLLNLAGPVDYNWWSHSVCALDLIDGQAAWGDTRSTAGKLFGLAEFERVWGMNHPVTGGFGVRIWNSWGDSWSDRGMGALTADKAVPDGCVILRSSVASAA